MPQHEPNNRAIVTNRDMQCFKHVLMDKTVRLSFGKATFLAGSGISIASGLPSGMAFNRQIAGLLAGNKKQKQRLQRLLIVNDRDRSTPRLRFEQIIALFRQTVDPEMDLLRLFDSDVEPGPIHHFLAKALKNRAGVFTTNFDSLIEKAYYRLAPTAGTAIPKLAVACMNERSKAFRGHSFQEITRLPRRPTLHKLHGTVSLYSDQTSQSTTKKPILLNSVGATLDQIGESGATLRLEQFKHQALVRYAKGRDLVVVWTCPHF